MKSLFNKIMLEVFKVVVTAALSAFGLYCSGCVQYTDGAPVIQFGTGSAPANGDK